MTLGKNFLLVLLLSAVFPCEKAYEIKKNTFLELETLKKAVQKYNESLHQGNHEGIIIEGTVEISHLESDDFHLVFLVSNSRVYRKYDFQYSREMGKIEMPNEIKKGQVTYLGDNLVIQDLDKRETYTFLVETFQNRFEETNPYLGIGLGSQIFEDKSSLLSAAKSCSCDCKPCSDCNLNCGSVIASCSCDGNSQSKTCSTCYNAACGQCPSTE